MVLFFSPLKKYVFIKRLWRSVKYEEVYPKGYESLTEAHLVARVLRAVQRGTATSEPRLSEATSRDRIAPTWNSNPHTGSCPPAHGSCRYPRMGYH